ncbi:DUF2322 family protein [Thioclava sp. GXIMD4216]|uniref:DUF2322 family protein n=1 Tax=Thioclava sp. GXIMD4216 TaxID=3131929 RepID=UPI0030CC9D48
MIAPTASFKDNLALLPPIDGLSHIELLDATGTVLARIENKPGKQGSLAVYHYLAQMFGALDAQAATYAIALFAEHSLDAKARPGAHPNIDRLFEITQGAPAQTLRVVAKV